MMMRQNPYRSHTPPGWNDMSSAPRDGTWVEIQNNWGVAPWFGKYKWENGGWTDGGNSGVTDGSHLSWRATSQEQPYSAPTEQNTRAYWIRASGLNPADYGAVDGETYEQEELRKPYKHRDEPKKGATSDTVNYDELLTRQGRDGLAASRERTVTELSIKADTTTRLDAVMGLLRSAANIAYNRKQGAMGHRTAEEDFGRISDALDEAMSLLNPPLGG